MNRLIILYFFTCLACLAKSQSSEGGVNYGLKAMIRKVGRDTMTKKEFFNYGIVKVSDSRFTVNSFTMVFHNCSANGSNDSWFRDLNGNSFNTPEIMTLLKSVQGCVLVVIDNVKFLNFKNQVVDTKEPAVVMLID